METTTAICVWLDSASDPTNPVWIVSLDTLELPHGNAETTRTLSTHDTEAEAMDEARKVAVNRGMPLYRNSESGPAELVEA